MDKRHYDHRKLEKLRGDKSLREKAKELGVTPNMLSRAERGDVATYDFLCELAEHYGISLGELLYAVQSVA